MTTTKISKGEAFELMKESIQKSNPTFFQKWKKGIEMITPYQQAQLMYKNTWIMILGITLGLIVALLALKQLWWLAIILAAALFNTILVQIANYQKYMLLKRMEESI